MIDEKILKEWVSAMLSGRYEEERQRLRSQDGLGFDPLGVLLDVIDPLGWRKEADVRRDTWWWTHEQGRGLAIEPDVLPRDLQVEITRRWCNELESWEGVASFIREVLPARIAHEHQRLERAA